LTFFIFIYFGGKGKGKRRAMNPELEEFVRLNYALAGLSEKCPFGR
jgi:hypothetical protein